MADERRLYAVTSVPADISPGRPTAGPVRALVRRPLFLGIAAGALVLLGILYMTRRDTIADLTPEEAIAADAAPGIAVLPFTVIEPDNHVLNALPLDQSRAPLPSPPRKRPPGGTIRKSYPASLPSSLSRSSALYLVLADLLGPLRTPGQFVEDRPPPGMIHVKRGATTR